MACLEKDQNRLEEEHEEVGSKLICMNYIKKRRL